MRVRGELKAGVEWFMTTPRITDAGVRGRVRSGYQAVANNNLSYPTVGALPSGKGTLSYSLMGENHYPSMAFSRLDVRRGVEKQVRIVADGKAPDDGFTSYKAEVGDPPRTRWGDYGAAAMVNGSIWFAGEWIAKPVHPAGVRTRLHLRRHSSTIRQLVDEHHALQAVTTGRAEGTRRHGFAGAPPGVACDGPPVRLGP